MSEIETGANMRPLLSKKEPNVLFREEEECMVDESKMYINKGQDDQMVVEFFRRNSIKTALTYMGFILTCGLLRLLYHWVPHLYLFSTCSKCNIEDAQCLLISENFKGKHFTYHVIPLRTLTADKIDHVKHEDDNDITKLPDELSVNFGTGVFQNVKELLSFTVKEITYIYHKGQKAFIKLPGLDSGVTCDKFHRLKGLSSNENVMRRIVYGLNLISIKESSVLTLLWLEVLNPFYIFQVVSTILWICSQYYYYPIAIFLMSFYSASMIIRQTKKNQRNLKATVHSSDYYTVLRPASRSSDLNHCPTKVIPTSLLVPGDLIEIPSFGCVMHCDAVLLTGNCVVNEAMLTGESVPVTKTALPNLPDTFYDTTTHSRHTLFCGTSVIQTRYLKNEKVLAAVVRTGYSTSKGSLVRSILHPPPVDYRFEKDSYKFVVFLGLIALVGFVYTVITKVMAGISAKELILQALDLITIVVPPALPAAMSVGRYYAQKRLGQKKISCISPRTINVSGGIDCVCFDKTGTLTEEGLDLLCVVPSDGKSFGPAIKNVDVMSYNDTFFGGLVCCHSLTVVDNQVVGDPLDLKMFEFTKWVIDESHIDDNNKYNELVPTVLKPPNSSGADAIEDCLDIGMLKQFPFSSSAQRMGVIVRKLNGAHFDYYCKGSPEMILNFVKKETVPIDFADILESYTEKGYRVIAMAHRELKMNYVKMQKASRDVIENDLTFLGFIVLENRLKPKTLPSIQALNEANIRVVMATGDNILTAISVARECKIVLPSQNVITVTADECNPPNLHYTLNGNRTKIAKDISLESGLTEISRLTSETECGDSDDETDINVVNSVGFINNYRFALSGKTWAVIKENYPELLPKICTRGSVFARMSPEQKQQLVQELQSLDYCVAMCGDGANDCGALKAAHAGISLSEAESSVASPFTSRNPDISCVVDVIREGRAALSTSFGVFKYMAGYSLCQFVSVLILYSVGSNLTDLEYLHIDLGIITVFAFYFGKTEAYPGKLHKRPPLTSLISFAPILSLLVNVTLIVLFQVLAFVHLRTEPWYVPNNKTDPFDVGCLENYTIFSISSFQYVILAIVFSKGYPYRKSMVTNCGLILSAILMTVCSVYLTLYPARVVRDYMEIVLPPSFDFRLYLVGYAALHFVLGVSMESLVDKLARYKGCRCVSKKSGKKYNGLERILKFDQFWPPFNTDSTMAKGFSDRIATSPRIEMVIMEVVDKFEKNHALSGLYVEHEDTPNGSLDTSSPLAARNWQDRKRER